MKPSEDDLTSASHQPESTARPDIGQKAPRLQDTIGIFESLSRQAVSEQDVITARSHMSKSRDKVEADYHASSDQKPGRGFSLAWKRLSGSWGKSRLGRAMTRQVEPWYRAPSPGREVCNYNPNSLIQGRAQGANNEILDLDGPNTSSTDFRLPVAESPARLLSNDPLCLSWTSGPGSYFSVGGCQDEGEGSRSSGHGIESSWRRRMGAGVLNSKPTVPGSLDVIGLNGEELPRPRRASGRRWMSRSSGTLIARAQCELEQPRPVRASEVKRLVSLCRDKVAGWRVRTQSE